MSTHWVLLFAYHFPPENTVGAARPFRFYKYLGEEGFRCHVITAADVRQLPQVDGEQVRDPFVAEGPRTFGWQFERAFRKFLIPGSIGTAWSWRAAAAAARFIREHPGDRFTVFSTFPPLGSHFAAVLLLRRVRVRWIADFRDPLQDNPIYRRLGKHTKWLFAFIEKAFLRRASAFIANTDAARHLLQTRYPSRAKDIHLIWNGFDPEQRITALPVAESGARKLSHIGELYEGRNVGPLLQSMARLRKNGDQPALNTHINQTGPAEPDCLPSEQETAAAMDEGWLSIRSQQVPKAEAQMLAQTSDMLLLVQPQSAVQVPGKLYDYLQIGRPILALVPRESAVERILSQAGVPYRCVYTGTEPADFDRILAEFLTLSSDPVPASQWFETNFNGRSQTAALAKIIRGQ